MTISLELIKPTDAYAKKYVTMFKEFRKSYEGTTRTEEIRTKDLLKISREDIKKQYCFWIKQNNRIIGFCLAPLTWKDTGEIVGRYLDTRYILKPYRNRGVGGRVLDILTHQLGVSSVKINSKHLEDTGHYWPNKGFRYAVPAHAVDPNFKIERNHKLFDRDYLHWYIFHETSKEIVPLISSGLPMLDLQLQRKINVGEEA